MSQRTSVVAQTPIDRLDALEREIPEWKSWTAMLRVLADAIGDPVWRDPLQAPSGAGDGRPRLDALPVRVPEQPMVDLVRTLLDIALDAASSLPLAERNLERVLPLVQASITSSASEIDLAAGRMNVPPPLLATVAHAAAIPLLNACAVQSARDVPVHWAQGYCPVCGARPVLAELIGLDRSRRLRCGRCGTGWDAPWLVCAFCREADHAQLGGLVPGAAPQGHKVETCATCRGYLKSIAVLTSGGHFEVMLADLETVALDIAAQGEGYRRPAGLGHPLSVQLFAGVTTQ